ncbi:uncharacterized protein SCHCODRAFT_02280045 [Schizophyllum commune H4-8]|uniref:uncharacterized protein n=1 Tax=Schizophyllum commune (strain H4-8 / FGSC 9210) TaxID=578458 RepID=UPI00215FFCDF|nr:uncharacterized protein SCHCODRAFT_02280045 [Schizophyllum commune H4-8]KAI5892001.1 hypothetical protein SCHCODRAFT_02280045 [Schizophyllum commune H4-8]
MNYTNDRRRAWYAHPSKPATPSPLLRRPSRHPSKIIFIAPVPKPLHLRPAIHHRPSGNPSSPPSRNSPTSPFDRSFTTRPSASI